jgi:hypothetical protein
MKAEYAGGCLSLKKKKSVDGQFAAVSIGQKRIAGLKN